MKKQPPLTFLEIEAACAALGVEPDLSPIRDGFEVRTIEMEQIRAEVVRQRKEIEGQSRGK